MSSTVNSPKWLVSGEDSRVTFKRILKEIEDNKRNLIKEYTDYLNSKYSYLFNKKLKVADKICYLSEFAKPEDYTITPRFFFPKKDGSMSQRPMYIYTSLQTEDDIVNTIKLLEDE